MELEAKGIIIDKQKDGAAELERALQPELVLTDTEVVPSLYKAAQAFNAGGFDICFVSETFPLDELPPFFADVRMLQQNESCIFVQVRKEFEPGFDRASLTATGFSTVISRKATDGDKSALERELTELILKHELKRKKVDVDTAIKLIMLELDRAACDRKRGIIRKFQRNVISDFVNDQVGFHDDVWATYIKALEQYADKGKPFEEMLLELPDDIKERGLPGIVDGEYVGTSLRVWEMLRERYGTATKPGSPSKEESQRQDPKSAAAARVKAKLKQMGLDESDT